MRGSDSVPSAYAPVTISKAGDSTARSRDVEYGHDSGKFTRRYMGRTFRQRSTTAPSATPLVTASAGGFANAVALKENQIQLVTDPHGNIAKDSAAGHGLYMLDTRYLSQFELLVNDLEPIYLSHSADRNYIATFQFVNQSWNLADGTRVPRQTISIRRSRFVDETALYERIGFYNCN